MSSADELRAALRHIRDLGCEYTTLCRADSHNERGDLCRSCYADDALVDDEGGPVHVERREELQLTCVDRDGKTLADPINLLSFGAECRQTMIEKRRYRDPRVQRRIVTTTRSESPWVDVSDDELERAAEAAR